MKNNITGTVNLLLRTLLLAAGLFFLALGVALSIKTGLGVSPVSSVAYVLSMMLPLSMGVCTALQNILFLLIQLVLLRRDFKPARLLQLAVVFLFSFFTDFTIRLVAPLEVGAYPLRLGLCVLSCALMGFGVFLEVRAQVVVMANEGALSVIAARTGKEFGVVKIINDLTLIALTVVLSLAGFGKILGVREGTLIAAVCVGLFAQFFHRYVHVFDRIFEGGLPAALTKPVPAGARPLVITIEREWGSGGHEIGEMLAKKLGFAFYDTELIEQAAARAGLPANIVQKREERIKGLLYTLYNQANAFTLDQSAEDAIFEAQTRIIREIAEKESCVIVGRLAAYILRDRPNCFHIFLAARDDFRLENLSLTDSDREEMLEMLHREDALRASFCRHFTGKAWGSARHYALCLDSSFYGLDGTLELILKALEKRINAA